MPIPLSDAEVNQALTSLAGWSNERNCLEKKFLFGSYMDGVRFVEAVAVDAEARDHHPDLLLRYHDVTVFLSTHSVGAVTQNDVESAHAVDRLATAYGAR